MATDSSGSFVNTPDWGSDFFGTLNDMPAEPVSGIAHILETMGTLPAFRDARRWVLDNFQLAQGASVLEAGCGTGAALADVLAVVGPNGRVMGVDPTVAFIERARRRAADLGAPGARYESGDIRAPRGCGNDARRAPLIAARASSVRNRQRGRAAVL